VTERTQPSVSSWAGLAWSLRAEADRAKLSALGQALGTPVVFLKGAWAEPVLYGNRGLRSGCDLDILVQPECFAAFAQALVAKGYRRWEFPTHPVTWEQAREWAFSGPPGHLDVDLHRELLTPPWYRLPTAALLMRAQFYQVQGGPSVLSLAPEDQVLFCAGHYASHCYQLPNKHLEDLVRLCQVRSIDWQRARARAQEAGLSVALAFLEAALARREVKGMLPPVQASLGVAWRQRLLAMMVQPGVAGFTRSRRLPRPWDALVVNTLASSKSTALPKFLGDYLRLRALDHLARGREVLGV